MIACFRYRLAEGVIGIRLYERGQHVGGGDTGSLVLLGIASR